MNNVEKLQKRIQSFAALGDGWDSYGGKRIEQKILDHACEIAHNFAEEGWGVYPSNGGVEFEHENGNSLSINPNGTYDIYVTTKEISQIHYNILNKNPDICIRCNTHKSHHALASDIGLICPLAAPTFKAI